ncbi:MAG: hypothetical protein ACJAYC_002010 [Halieaceae bacterium]|jgi:hypothetical protein
MIDIVRRLLTRRALEESNPAIPAYRGTAIG